jgi:predicted DNA-binding transcriptional regulator AlpA
MKTHHGTSGVLAPIRIKATPAMRRQPPDAAVSHHFDHVGPEGLVQMWETGKNLEGKKLSDFEFQALVEAWCRVFGEFPPFDDDAEDDVTPQEPAISETELPQDDTMLGRKEVVRLTGVSWSTIQRIVLDGRFPKPMRPSPHRIGWPARDVRAFLEELDSARRKTRS